MNRLYLPTYTPIYNLGDILCIGFVHVKHRYCELDFSIEMYEELKTVLLEGVSIENQTPLIQSLVKANLLVSKIQKDYSNRGELFLEYLGNQYFDDEVKKSPILIFGVGAIGATLTYLLAQFGFSNIAIADFDIVEQSDILKTMVYDNDQKGMLKVDALKDKIWKNFGTEIRTYFFNNEDYDSIKSIVESEKPIIVVKACDPDLIFRLNLNKVCHEKAIPHLNIAYSFENLVIGPLYVPNLLGCDNCINLVTQETYGTHYAFENHNILFRDLIIHPSISFNINIISNLALKELLFFLTGNVENCFSIGRIVVFNPLSLSYTSMEIEKNKNCHICNPV